MRKLFASLFGRAQSGTTTASDGQLVLVDPRVINYSIPTISGELAPLDELTEEPKPDEPSFHEDDWRQVEFLRGDYLPELKAMLKEYQAFEQSNRVTTKVNGNDCFIWRNLYLRKIRPQTIIAGPNSLDRLESIVGGKRGPAPVLFSSRSWIGKVKGGFTLSLGGGSQLYGCQHSGDVEVLGALVGENPNDEALLTAFGKLNASEGLVLVDWKMQFVLLSLGTSGKIEVWQP